VLLSTKANSGPLQARLNFGAHAHATGAFGQYSTKLNNIELRNNNKTYLQAVGQPR
jgi:hypothetical protein